MATAISTLTLSRAWPRSRDDFSTWGDLVASAPYERYLDRRLSVIM